jgi:hypothetical protein
VLCSEIYYICNWMWTQKARRFSFELTEASSLSERQSKILLHRHKNTLLLPYRDRLLDGTYGNNVFAVFSTNYMVRINTTCLYGE